MAVERQPYCRMVTVNRRRPAQCSKRRGKLTVAKRFCLLSTPIHMCMGKKQRQAICLHDVTKGMKKMKHKKRLFTLFLALITALSFSTSVWAAEPESSIAAEHGDHSLAISPRRGCTVCTIGYLKMVCEKQRYWDDVGSHYSWGKKCIVNYFRSGAHYLCTSCGAISPLDYADEFGGEHLCVENHSSCGLGDKNICAVEAVIPPYVGVSDE